MTWFERDLCQLVLQAPEARAALLPLIDAAAIAHPAVRAILTALRDAPTVAPEALLQRLPDDAQLKSFGCQVGDDGTIYVDIGR